MNCESRSDSRHSERLHRTECAIVPHGVLGVQNHGKPPPGLHNERGSVARLSRPADVFSVCGAPYPPRIVEDWRSLLLDLIFCGLRHDILEAAGRLWPVQLGELCSKVFRDNQAPRRPTPEAGWQHMETVNCSLIHYREYDRAWESSFTINGHRRSQTCHDSYACGVAESDLGLLRVDRLTHRARSHSAVVDIISHEEMLLGVAGNYRYPFGYRHCPATGQFRFRGKQFCIGSFGDDLWVWQRDLHDQMSTMQMNNERTTEGHAQ